MKLVTLFTAMCIVFGLLSCHKPKKDPELIVSNAAVKTGELVTVKILNAPAGKRISWNLPLMLIRQITSDASTASLMFTFENPGDYEIGVNFINNDSTL